MASEISGSSDQDGGDDCRPAVTRCDPRKLRSGTDDPPHDAKNIVELGNKVLLLTLFSAIEQHAINVLVKAYEREAQFGLLSIAVSIELGQRAADEPANP